MKYQDLQIEHQSQVLFPLDPFQPNDETTSPISIGQKYSFLTWTVGYYAKPIVPAGKLSVSSPCDHTLQENILRFDTKY